MRTLVFEQSAFDDFFDWGVYDKRIFIKIHDLLKAILRDPFKGPGQARTPARRSERTLVQAY